ncbi:hypothetical protein BCL69_10832 [Nitrosomonas communis]|uniref:Uncharacterized protein n=1 Tax=Nitrosomonas communis TaxID=44574 RepID=A0A0F7KHC4_9PROT|nr:MULTISPECIES: hypothetical protein [Nitrosomonas]AKH38533.1 hypothetical protein AAW31_13200 [Nitrosomonas communis]TYP75781.1 hypothetical protein BCL69_10832 [Nitrosomonas communis]UVS60581.1 hypothetical protein NX761_13875 [Nitrosomonas sp. PLL12]
MPGIGKGGFDILPFVEGRFVHDSHAGGQELGQEVRYNPCMEDVGVDIRHVETGQYVSFSHPKTSCFLRLPMPKINHLNSPRAIH